jgi:ATP-dependent Lon protease
VVAAHAAGIRRVMLPARNRKDFDDIPEEVRNHVEFIWLERVEEAVANALDPALPLAEAAAPAEAHV